MSTNQIIVDAGVEKLVVSEMDTGQTLDCMGAIFRVIKTVENTPDADIYDVLAQVPHDCIEIIASAVNKPVEYVRGLKPDTTLELAAAVLQVNKDFFYERVLPKLTVVILKFQTQRKAKTTVNLKAAVSKAQLSRSRKRA